MKTRVAEHHAEAASVPAATGTNAFLQHENIGAATMFVLHGT